MIRNVTTGEIISHRERICKTPFSWSRGLMFHSRENLVMMFPEKRPISLHMWFVFYPIEVLVVDEKLQVIAIKPRFLPWTFWSSPLPGKYLVELGEQQSQQKVSLGDTISFG